MQLKSLASLSCAAASGVFAGTLIERRRNGSPAADLEPARKMPGLPVFGTVSAATPFSGPEGGGAVVPAPASPLKPADSAVAERSFRTGQIMRFGFPGLDNVRSHRDYVISYDRRTRAAHWVFEHLTRDSVKRSEGVDRTKSEFREDNSIHRYFRAQNADFKYSGFDRGQLAAAGNHRKCQEHCDETFLLSNMSPQVGVGFNRDKWEQLERHVRSLTKLYANVYVCTGPLYLPKRDLGDGKNYVRYQVIGKNNVAVPTHFFKVVVAETASGGGDLEMEAYVMPNEAIPDSAPLASFQVPPDSVERAAGLLFFDRLDRQRLKRINGGPKK